MKLVRYGQPGRERPGIWLEAAGADAARIVDVRGMAFDIEDYNARFWRTHGLERLRGLLAEEGLKTLAADPELRRRLGSRGRELVVERHTWPASAGKLAELYRQLLNRS